MHQSIVTIVAVILTLNLGHEGLAGSVSRLPIEMPSVIPDHSQQYLCTAKPLSVDRNGSFVVGFNPRGDATRVHHMLVYGCASIPYESPEDVWDCGEMHRTGARNLVSSFPKGPVCSSGTPEILYGWALDAPALKLPENVGFKVGGSASQSRYLVLQVHYGHHHNFEKLPDLKDSSGITLDMISDDGSSGITKRAGVMVLISLGEVGKGKTRHQIWCDIDEDIEAHPFRYRVHTHKLGTRVMGAKLATAANRFSYVRDGFSIAANDPEARDVILGDMDPRRPQMFYPVDDDSVVIRKGDTIYATCEFDNNQTRIVGIGQTANDEMCNFYMMYWTTGDNLLTQNCYGENFIPSFKRFVGWNV